MDTEFIRFKATDGVELQGWLSRQDGGVAAIHAHGMGGNGYENNFLDNLREIYTQKGITFFTFDNRGRGIISDFRHKDGWKRGGSCFEIFEESIFDIEGALGFLKSQGYSRFILQGHSLGCSKIVHFMVSKEPSDIEKVVLLAPTDMVEWANADPEHEQNLVKARQLLSEGKGEELVGAQCWPLDKTPLSAQAYVSKSDTGSLVDIYGVGEGGEVPIRKVAQPMLIPYGTEDIGITHPFGSMDVFEERLDKIKHPNTELVPIEGSDHGFRDYEDKLTSIVEEFIRS